MTTNQNSHDSFPIRLADGHYGLYYAKSTGGQPYDLMRRVSTDGAAWGVEESLEPYVGWDTQPHPILLTSNAIAMAWARGLRCPWPTGRPDHGLAPRRPIGALASTT